MEEQVEGSGEVGCQSIRRVGIPRAAGNSGEWTGARAEAQV